jgi:tryptophan synthase beta chain
MKKGYFGQWGGAFIPEVLYQTFAELNAAYEMSMEN